MDTFSTDEARTFGRLNAVSLRTAWTREDTHFTPWLADELNLALLSETVGIELELQAQEQSVGPFRADLLCKNTADGSLVLIENQIERTDHTHLGQVITYAAGLDAVTVIWIAKRFTEEHRAAIDWLNDISHERIRFFGLEIELWRIGQSPIAPKFNVIARPNDWAKTVRDSTGGATTEHQRFRYEFWGSFLTFLDEAGSTIASNRTPSREHWMTWGIGRSNFSVAAAAGFRDKWCSVYLIISGDSGPANYETLRSRNEELAAAIGDELSWDYRDDRKSNYISVMLKDVDPKDRAQWPRINAWLREKLEVFDRVFRGVVAEIGHSPS